MRVLRGASLCLEGRLGLFPDGEALLVGLRGASLEEFAGNGWFFSSEAGDIWLRRASLLSRMVVLAEMF